jgi:hypothetical protein
MRKKLILILSLAIVVGLSFVFFGFQKEKKEAYPIEPIPFTSVHISDKFWGPKIRRNFEITIPIAIDQCYKTGRVDNLSN